MAGKVNDKQTEEEEEEINERKWFLLSFIKFADKKTSLSLLLDCVEDSVIETAPRKHEANGFREITGSRSKECCVKEAEVISITFGGELQAGKAVPKSSIKVGKCFSISPATVAVKVNKNANYCIIHYEGSKSCKAHTVLFSVNEEFKLMSTLRTRKFSDSDYPSGKHDAAAAGARSASKGLTESTLTKTPVVREVDFAERQAFLQELTLRRYQFLVSSVYRCHSDDGTEASVPASLLRKTPTIESLYTFSYFVLRNGKWNTLPASYCERSSSVKGKVSSEDVFCAVAEFTAERMTVGKNGGSFVSKKDNRVQVNIPDGALDSPTDFTFRVFQVFYYVSSDTRRTELEAVDLNRYRAYGEHLPDIFNCLVGFPTSLNIEHEMRGPLKQKAKVYLPVIGDGDEKEILFLHWEDNIATPLNHRDDTASPETPYYVEVDHFSTISAQTKKTNTTLNETINATRLLLGQASVCIILTYIVPNYMRGMPGLMVDCVELPRVKTVTKDYADEGYKELPGSRSKDCSLEESGYISVDVGGNIQLEPGIRKKDMRLRFFKNTSSNRIMVPVKLMNQSQTLSSVIYTTLRKQWEHKVYFSVSDYIEKDAVVRQKTRVCQEPKSKGLPPVLSEKSLSALGKALPESTWLEVGLELDLTHDNITLLIEKNKNTSSVGFAVLRDWMQKSAREPSEKLVGDLVAAFEEVERVDIAEVIRNASATDNPIRRSDFVAANVRKADPESSVSGHAHSSGSDGNVVRTKNLKPFKA